LRAADQVTRLLEGLDEDTEAFRSSQKLRRWRKVLGRPELSGDERSPAGSRCYARRRSVDVVENRAILTEDKEGLQPRLRSIGL